MSQESVQASNFFPQMRRKLELADWSPLMNEQSEKRLRLDLLMPLSGQNAVGMPGFIGDAFEEMAHEQSATTEVRLSGEIEGMTLETYSTDTAEFPIEAETAGLDLSEGELGRRHILLTGCTLRAFKLVRITRDTQSLIALKFSVTSKSDVALVLWAYRYHGAYFWGMFTASEPELQPAEDLTSQMSLGAAAEIGPRFAGPNDEKCAHPECDLKPHDDGDHEQLVAVLPGDRLTALTPIGEEGDAGPPAAASTDELYPDAVKLCQEFGSASTSLLQRRLRIGYGRAAHLIDRMEDEGIVGPAEGAAPRALLSPTAAEEQPESPPPAA